MNCKPGDLAVQIACPFYPKNIGSFYTVIEHCACHFGAWSVDPKQDVIENVSLMNQIGVVCRAGDSCCVWDNELKPIRGLKPTAHIIITDELETT